uniref:Fibrinogen C-terminal domain-containing protein n=1 Tax=Catharus ustulatus TaxID=91951 RepID=A0A8C3UMD4_CATUS
MRCGHSGAWKGHNQIQQVRKSLKSYLGKASEQQWLCPVEIPRADLIVRNRDVIITLSLGQSTEPLCCTTSAWPKDCSEIPRGSHSGVYIIQPKGLHHLVVYCEMNVTHGGWTVIQRNQRDTPVTWAESWSTYKFGFGNVRTEYWLGTEYIHQIAKQKVYQVRFVIQDSADAFSFADYNLFSVEDESQGYRLRLGSYNGTAGDAMTSDNPNNMHDNMKFSTKDRDQDTYSKNCAYSYEGGWWYSSCYSVRLNYKGGMTWGNLCKGNCKSSLILIKPASYC